MLDLKPSNSIRFCLIALHALATLAALISAIPLIVKVLLVIAVAASFLYHVKQHNPPTQLVWRTGNRWFINQEQVPAELIAINFYSRWLVILSLLQTAPKISASTPTKRPRPQKFVIPFDALDTETFRVLRVRLRIEGYDLLHPSDESIK